VSRAAGQRRFGILGGAFDPVHLAHVALARAACQQLQLAQIRIIPTGQAWHRPRPLTAASHRLAMARLAFADMPQAVLDERELRREGVSYTVDTLRELRAELPQADWFLVVGEDQARALHTWRAWQEIVSSATICVAQRHLVADRPAEFPAQQQFPASFRTLNFPAHPVSATAIRAAVAAGQDVTDLVGPDVARYIAHHHLYSHP